MNGYVVSPLLRDVLARFGGFHIFLVGIYVILQVAGLARFGDDFRCLIPDCDDIFRQRILPIRG